MTQTKSASLVFTIETFFQFIGIWPKNNNYLRVYVARIAIMCYLTVYLFQLIDLGMSRNDIGRVFECFSVISFSGMGILKIYSMCFRDQWVKILKKMSDLEESQLESNETYSVAESQHEQNAASSIKKYARNFVNTSTLLLRIYYFTAIIFVSSPFVEYVFLVLRGDELVEYPHILPSWNPLDNVHFACFIVTVISEAIAAIYCVSVHISFDSAAIGVMIFVCGQFSILFHQCEGIGGSGICNTTQERDAIAQRRIAKSHDVHLQLVSIITELDKLLRNILGVYFFVATLTLCSVAVRLKSEQMSAMELASLLQYMVGSLAQLYIFCSFGDAVYSQSAIGPGEGPFGAAIWAVSPKIRKDLSFLGFAMMKRRRLHAGPFNYVDKPSFIQIGRAAYSYYAVLSNSNK